MEAEANNARFIVHAVQLMPELNCKAGMEFYKLIDLHEHPNSPLAFAVKVRSYFDMTIFYRKKFLIAYGNLSGRTSHGTVHDKMVG